MKKIRILTVLNNLNKCDGISSYVMNYYNKFDLEKIHMDFVVVSNKIDEEYRKIIESKGGTIFYIKKPLLKSMLKDVKTIKVFLNIMSNEYDIIHSHVINSGYLFLKYAKKYGIKCRILHSHNTTLGSDKILKNIRNTIIARKVVSLSTDRFACSKEAGKYLFGNSDFKVIHNAIDVQKYVYNQESRDEYRKKLGVQDNIVLLHVGRLDTQKNHMFLLDVFKEVVEVNPKYKLVLVGTGNLEQQIKNKIKELNIEKSVIMLGVRNDVNNILSASDIFLLPSLFEGLPVVAIEAQTSDIKCILANTITVETKILPNLEFVKLDKFAWKNTILNTKIEKRKNNSVEIKNAGYYINSEFERLQNIYSSILENLK